MGFQSSDPDAGKLYSKSESSESEETICLDLDLILIWAVQGLKAFCGVWNKQNLNSLTQVAFKEL